MCQEPALKVYAMEGWSYRFIGRRTDENIEKMISLTVF